MILGTDTAFAFFYRLHGVRQVVMRMCESPQPPRYHSACWRSQPDNPPPRYASAGIFISFIFPYTRQCSAAYRLFPHPGTCCTPLPHGNPRHTLGQQGVNADAESSATSAIATAPLLYSMMGAALPPPSEVMSEASRFVSVRRTFSLLEFEDHLSS